MIMKGFSLVSVGFIAVSAALTVLIVSVALDALAVSAALIVGVAVVEVIVVAVAIAVEEAVVAVAAEVAAEADKISFIKKYGMPLHFDVEAFSLKSNIRDNLQYIGC